METSSQAIARKLLRWHTFFSPQQL